MKHTIEEYKQFAAKVYNSDYAEIRITKEIEFCDSVRKVISDAAVMIELEQTENHESYDFNHTCTEFTRSNIIFWIKKDKNNFSIFPDRSNYLNGVSFRSIEKAQSNLTCPNKIGVLTEKKVQAWVDYYTDTIANLKEMHTEAHCKEAEFLQQIAGEQVMWEVINKKGVICRNGLIFIFSLEEGNIYTKVDFDYRVGHDFAAFQPLADNRCPTPGI